jgi:hypothetical protein
VGGKQEGLRKEAEEREGSQVVDHAHLPLAGDGGGAASVFSRNTRLALGRVS